ncbi:DUF1430 domain-containing protein [Mediannikoviicoccus vaginalis]|uniref:DUF1430 domain-containing protein n=1 Tax=Mediannikoviicoccus vaginalis TaxID=2899727 RepID=UPI001F2521ED|nr:DUF1430 domain-containing protein [Mediannikoviicoccus vaginalis]
MQSEIFQNELFNFSTAYYKASSFEVSSENIQDFLDDAQKASSKNNVEVFSYYREIKSKFRFTLHIYGDSDVIRKSIKDVANVEEKQYTSLISGITDVKYHDLKELETESVNYENLICYIGDETAVNSTYKDLEAKYNLTSPQYWNATEKDMMIIVWGMISLLMIIMNLVEVIRRKKEIAVRVLFGESVSSIVFKTAIINLVSSIVIFILAKLLMLNFISGAYENKLIILIYLVGVALSTLPYFIFYSMDIKKLLSNATDSKVSMYLLYALKLIAGALTIITLITNISSINGNLFADGSLLKSYYNANYLRVQTEGFDYDKEQKFWDEVYEKEYSVINPSICINISSGKNDVVFVNDNGKDMLQGFKESVEKESSDENDLIIFIPKGKSYEENKMLAYDRLDFCFKYPKEDFKDWKIKYVEYSDSKYFSYLDNNSIDGVERTKNPILIYQLNNDLKIDGANLQSYKGEAILFNTARENLEEICSKYEDILGNYNQVITNVEDQYNYNHTFFVKLLAFLSSLCVVIIFLDIAIILAVSQLEFRRNAMKISLMKILGYGIFNRHKSFLRLIMIENLVIFTGFLILSLILKRIDTEITILVSALVILIEFIIIIFNIIRIERTNVQKSLKGGCL